MFAFTSAASEASPAPGAINPWDHTGLAMMVVSRLRRRAECRAVEVEDLENTALLALHRAAAEYRPGETKFSTFAVAVIKHALLDFLGAKSHRPWQQLPVDERGEVVEQPDPGAEAPDVTAERADAVAWVKGAMGRVLTRREQQVLQLHFGLGGEEVGGVNAVAAVLNISRARADQLLRAAVAKLRGVAGEGPAPVRVRSRTKCRRRRLRRSRQPVGAATASSSVSSVP
jgi:RNA polymerase sigma factor (sigma-70 family)